MVSLLRKTVWVFTIVGVLSWTQQVWAQTDATLVDTQADSRTSFLTTWPPQTLNWTLGCQNYRWRDIADNLYTRTSPYGYSTAAVQAQYVVTSGVLGVTLAGAGLKPNFAYQLKLVGMPTKKWGSAGNDWANERIGYSGRWWEAIVTSSGYIVDAGNSTNTEYNKWKRKKFYDARTKYTYIFEGYLPFNFVISNETGSFGWTPWLWANKSYHVLWQCYSTGATWNRYGYAPSRPVDTNNIQSTTISGSNISWYLSLPPGLGTFYVVPETEPKVLQLYSGSYKAFLLLTEESLHANLPPQYGPAYHDAAYGGCWMSAMCAQIGFTL